MPGRRTELLSADGVKNIVELRPTCSRAEAPREGEETRWSGCCCISPRAVSWAILYNSHRNADEVYKVEDEMNEE